MTREQGVLWLAEGVMFFALFCFLRGFSLRRTALARHMWYGKLGAACVVAGLLVIEALMRGLGWEFPIRSPVMLRWHITVSVVAFLLLLLLVYTGVRRIRRIHVRLYLFFFPAYLGSLVLSFCAFRLW